MIFRDELCGAIDAGSADAVVAALAGADEPARRAAALEVLARVQSLRKAGDWNDPRFESARLAAVGVATFSELRRLSWTVVPNTDAHVAAIFEARRPDWIGAWMSYVLETRTNRWVSRFDLARELTRRGLCAKPETPWYTLAMVSAFHPRRDQPDRRLRDWLLERPDKQTRTRWRRIHSSLPDSSSQEANRVHPERKQS